MAAVELVALSLFLSFRYKIHFYCSFSLAFMSRACQMLCFFRCHLNQDLLSFVSISKFCTFEEK